MTDTRLKVPEASQWIEATPQIDAGRSDRTVVIRPASRWPHLDLRELWRYRELALTFVWRDIKVRYKQTVIGVAWALFVPIFTATVYIVVFGKFAKFPSGDLKYPVLVVSGLLPMQYFTSALASSSASIVTGVNLVTKVYFPRILLPVAAVLVPAVDFCLGFVVLLGVMAFYGAWPSSLILLFFVSPAFLLLALVTALGVGLGLSALFVRYRDVQYAIPVFMQVLPLLSGVPFALDKIPEKWQWVLAVNPMSSAIAGWRWTILDAPAPDPAKVGVGVAVALVVFLGGLAYFRSSEPRFADTI